MNIMPARNEYKDQSYKKVANNLLSLTCFGHSYGHLQDVSDNDQLDTNLLYFTIRLL